MRGRFCYDTHPVALPGNIVQGECYRFTVLTPWLLRLEYDAAGIFEDRASQVVFHRDFPQCGFRVRETEKLLILETEALTLHYRPNAPLAEDSLVIKLKCEPGSTWHYGEEFEDLGGTARTLDRMDGSCPLDRGVCSRHGFSVIDDSDSLLLEEDGWFGVRRENTKDCYFFGYGFDYLEAVGALYGLTGAPPLLPGYALGNWWSRYHAYSQQEYLELMDRFREENIPFSVGVVDMDWHITKIPEELKDEDVRFSDGWTGYSWNRELFPDYRAFLQELKNRNLHTAMNLHPAQGVGAHEDMYAEMAAANGIDPAGKQRVKLDILSPRHMESYFDILHHPYEKDGVDFWWMDWQQGTDYWWIHEANRPGEYQNPLERMDPLWLLNHLHILDIQRDGKRPMFFSRYAGPGSHRYPVGFSGDTVISWDSLEFQPYFTATASNIGYSWWSHDIGGHMLGIRDDELLLRWVQLGVFSPINRLHSTCSRFQCKESWYYREDIRQSMAQWLRLRHSLFPYLYTMNYRTNRQWIPLVQPMYYLYPKRDAAYSVPNQYFFGSELMVAPITQKADAVSALGTVQVWLPKGNWFDFFTGIRYASKQGRKMTVCRPSGEMPVFAKAGAIVPMAVYEDYDNRLHNSDRMELLVFPGADNTFTLTEDALEGQDYRRGALAQTQVTWSWGKVSVLTIHPAEGDVSLIPQQRNWRIGLRGFRKDTQVSCLIGEAPCDVEAVYDGTCNTLWVQLCAPVTMQIQLSVCADMHCNEDVYDRCAELIIRGQGSIATKEEMWNLLTDETKTLEHRCLHLSANFPQAGNLSKALKELLTLTEDPHLGSQISQEEKKNLTK